MTSIHRELAARAEGIIVSHYGISVEVGFPTGERRVVRVKRNSGHVVGDAVTVAGEVLTRMPRRSELRRRDARGGIHLVAANLDVLGIVVAPMSPQGFVDRAIIAARSAGLTPFIVVNKCDLQETVPLVTEIKEKYAKIVPVFSISALERSGLDPLLQFLRDGHRAAFVGSTGVGKSSLLNALCPELNLKVGEVSEHKWQGRHTTTVSSLHQLAGGGELVDTPGFRDFGLVDLTSDEVAHHFPGMEELERHHCRFHNCRHRLEPGCRVTQRVADGVLPRERYDAYLTILGEVEALDESETRRAWRN